LSNHPARIQLQPSPPVDNTIRPPGSKSITNRALICAALADGKSQLSGVLDSEDTQVMVEAWKQLGLSLNWNRENESLTIEGCSGKLPCDRANLFVANSGTTIRFLTAALAVCHGDFVLDGVSRMRQRPIEDLLDGLRQLGADVQSINQDHPNCPPVCLRATGLRGGVSRIAGNVSSQFLSGLMMAAPYAQTSVELQIEGELVSKPYISMTSAVMKSFGCKVTATSDRGYSIHAPQRYRGCDYAIEPDASAASYFWAAAAITGGRARVEGLSKDALQGDVGFVEVLRQMGSRVEYGPNWIKVTGRAARGIDVDMNAISDTVQTLAAVALFADGPTRVRGVAHNRHKETDRIGDLATELRKLGAGVDEHEDGLTIHPVQLRPAEIETYNDHRMAMSLGLVGLRQEGVWILNPKCTEKTFPNYFEAMAQFAGCKVVS
jgi:3-phosphoshikimate 1-carboxyvinyltransferase